MRCEWHCCTVHATSPRSWNRPGGVLQTLTKEKSLTFQQETELHVSICMVCEKTCVAIFITGSVSWGWLITGPNINP